MADDVWFGGDEPRTDAEAVFLATVRAHADDWDAAGVRPADTTTTVWGVPLHLQVDLPGVPCTLVNLQVGFLAAPPAGPCVLGEWGDRYLLDRGSGLERDGSDPRGLAEVAVGWLLDQLARPLEVAEWWGGPDDVVASTWSLADSGEVLARTGTSWRRWRRRPPDRVRRVR